jgi:hypothetical protein
MARLWKRGQAIRDVDTIHEFVSTLFAFHSLGAGTRHSPYPFRFNATILSSF